MGTAVDRPLLANLATEFGPGGIGTILAAALAHPRVAIGGGADSAALIAGLINCLPVACRAEFSFATALRDSPHRPFRILAVDDDAEQLQRLSLQHERVLLDLRAVARNGSDSPDDGWAGFVAAALAGGKTSLLAAELTQPIPALGAAGLDDLGNRLRNKLLAGDGPPDPDNWPANFSEPAELPLASPPPDRDPLQRADAAHKRFQNNPRPAATQSYAAAPAGTADPSGAMALGITPEHAANVQELLEHLDDVVYGAINGQASALAELSVLWPSIVSSLGWQQVEESREQYLRCALSIWTDYLGASRQGPDKATAALDVMCLLFE
jgi:hypothetical protein